MKRRLEDRQCLYCGEIFRPSDATRKYCSQECSQKSRVLLRKHTCNFCGRQFESKRKRQKYCSVDCQYKSYKVSKICIICGVLFYPDYSTQNKCRNCMPKKGKILNKTCEICGKYFHPKRNEARYCSNKCKNISKTKVKDISCPICGKTFHQIDTKSIYCSKECFWKSDTWKTLPSKITKPNKDYKEYLESLGYNVEMEACIGNKSYDLKIDNIVIEINPFAYHNSTRFPYNKQHPKKANYHYIRKEYAISHGYKCIMVWDWTTKDELIRMIEDDLFHYNGEPQLHRYNPKTKEHIVDNGFDKTYMINNGFLEIYDCGQEIFTKN